MLPHVSDNCRLSKSSEEREMKIKSSLLLGAMCLTCVSFSAQATTIDLTAGTGNSGAANGAVFSNPSNVTTVGSGVMDPFVRIQNNGTESGFNTDAAVSLDTKSGTWTHSIQLGQIGMFTGDGTAGTVNGTVYRQFYLDINQNKGSGNLLSLDRLQIRVGNSSTPANFTVADAGALVFDLDVGPNGASKVLMDYSLFHGSGNGIDVGFLIPNAVFIGKNATDYVTMFADFGNTAGYEANAGFEEIAAAKCPLTASCAPPGGGIPPNAIPEPHSIALLALGLLALGVRSRSSRT